MKALVYEAPEQLRFGNVPEPIPVGGESLVRILASGICGSDMHAYRGHDPRRVPPMILGHEATGEALDGPYAGQLVGLNPLITCAKCDYCQRNLSNLCPNRTMHGMTRQGFYADIVAIPDQNVIPLPATISIAHGALMEPAGCVWRCISLAKRVLNRPLNDSRVLILGAGAIGLLATLMLQAGGCKDMLTGDTSALRRKAATDALESAVFDPSQQTFRDEFDLIIDAVGSPHTRRMAIDAVAPGGAIIHIGLQQGGDGVEARALTLKEIAFMGSYTYTHSDLLAALDLLNTGALGDLAWVEERPLADGVEAFRALAAQEVPAPKIILRTN